MFGLSKKTEAVMNDYDARDLKRLREEEVDRKNKEAVAEAERQRQEWISRTWVSEGSDTDVSSLKVDGGKILRIRGEYYFQRYEQPYVIGYAGNTYGLLAGGGQYYSASGGYSQPVKL